MRICFPAAAERLSYLLLTCLLLHGCLAEADFTHPETAIEAQLTRHLPALTEQLSTTTLQPQSEFVLPEAEVAYAEEDETFVF